VILRCAIDGTDAIVAIQDSGKGIDAERLAELGKPFATGREGGTGLGFLLARTAIEQHGATLELNSVPGKTVAQFRLAAMR
jgi:signal transduction histidine kinase